MLRTLRAAALITSATLAVAAPALADSAGTDPSANYPAPPMPASCFNAPTGTDCITASLAVLDQARASLGQPAYAIPSNFVALTPAEQGFVLANLDRILYGLAPVTGLTAALDTDAAAGVHARRRSAAHRFQLPGLDRELGGWVQQHAAGLRSLDV